MVTGGLGANGLKEIKVGSHEFSQNQKIVTDGFPLSLGEEQKNCYLWDLKSILGLENNIPHLKLSVIV